MITVFRRNVMKEGTILRKNNCYFHSPIYNFSAGYVDNPCYARVSNIHGFRKRKFERKQSTVD